MGDNLINALLHGVCDLGKRSPLRACDMDVELSLLLLYGLIIGNTGIGEQDHASDGIREKGTFAAVLCVKIADIVAAPLNLLDDAKAGAAGTGMWRDVAHR
jgi:hypothetical protein